jgi:hypothetical protein
MREFICQSIQNKVISGVSISSSSTGSTVPAVGSNLLDATPTDTRPRLLPVSTARVKYDQVAVWIVFVL